MKRMLAGAVLAASVLWSCGQNTRSSHVVLASTTSTEDTGLLDTLKVVFERSHSHYRIRVVAVGSGQALELGKRKDADVLLVHSPAAESTFMAQGYGVARCDVMFNEFVVLGPSADPALVRRAGSAAEAFRRIASKRSAFASRGDNSGTHARELQLWATAGVLPDSSTAYLSLGQGMAETLLAAHERGAYVLSDKATYLALKARVQLKLAILYTGDPILQNQYGVILVRDARNPKGGRAFARWLIGVHAQQFIRAFGQAEFGQSLFEPNAKRCQL